MRQKRNFTNGFVFTCVRIDYVIIRFPMISNNRGGNYSSFVLIVYLSLPNTNLLRDLSFTVESGSEPRFSPTNMEQVEFCLLRILSIGGD